MKRVLLLFVLVSLLAATAQADDLFPPEWRGEPRTTWQGWEFATSDPNPLPDLGQNPMGPPSTLVQPGYDQTWEDIIDGRQGVWPLSGTIDIEIPNYPDPNPEKWIWVQLTWKPQVVGDYALDVRAAPELSGDWVDGAPINEILLPDGWIHTTYEMILPYNPEFEQVFIGGTVFVDELVIDTYCVPEPATMGLLAFGGLMMIRRRR